MQMKLKDVIKNLNGLTRLGSATLPTKLSFAVSRNIEALRREAEHIEKEREKLCEEYAEKDKDGNAVMEDSIIGGKKVQSYKMSDEDRRLFNAEYEELMETETEVEIRTVSEEVIERCEEIERYSIPSVSDILALAFMTEE